MPYLTMLKNVLYFVLINTVVSQQEGLGLERLNIAEVAKLEVHSHRNASSKINP